MSKSKTRFSTPALWRPTGAGVMTQAQDGSYVRQVDYEELLQAYRFALVQLDRAAVHVATAKKGIPA